MTPDYYGASFQAIHNYISFGVTVKKIFDGFSWILALYNTCWDNLLSVVV